MLKLSIGAGIGRLIEMFSLVPAFQAAMSREHSATRGRCIRVAGRSMVK